MRKQKASDRRTRRAQRNGKELDVDDPNQQQQSLTGRSRGITKIFDDTKKKPTSPNFSKLLHPNSTQPKPTSSTRSRSSKRLALYSQINDYQTSQLTSLTSEFKYEESLILERLSSSKDLDPERPLREGEGCYDLLPSLRGELLGDHIYRLQKSDASELFKNGNGKFKPNDYSVITLQTFGLDDRLTSPVDFDSQKFEVVVSGVGPTYIDIVISDQLKFTEVFPEGSYLRIDRYFSKTSYERMCEAVKAFCDVEEEEENMRQYRDLVTGCGEGGEENNRVKEGSRFMSKPVENMNKEKAKLAYSTAQSKFPLNNSQLSAVALSLSRKLTTIIGPPGTGKTFTGCAVASGFNSLCSDTEKVLCCAYSNVGADNFARGLKNRGLRVLRIGRATAVGDDLVEDTLEFYLRKDRKWMEAMEEAKRATKISKNSRDSNLKTLATSAVKSADAEKMKASARIMLDFDVVVSTCIGAADAAILTAMGKAENYKPDSPLTFPYLIIDEACQSLEAATLVPLTTTRCKSLVLLGDPMQLPPTVLSSSPSLETSLMERLTRSMPAPVMVTAKKDSEDSTNTYLKTVNLSNTSKGKQGAKYISANAGGVLLKLQYRMHPSIAAYPSAQFYDGLLATPEALIAEREGGADVVDAVLKKIEGGGEVFGNVGIVKVESEDGAALEERSEGKDGIGEGTFKNSKEAETVAKIIATITNESKVAASDIGVITPYNGQKSLLKRILSEQTSSAGVEVNTVDGFQGREKRIIIFSAVRSNRGKKVGFLSDGRRMNVAITRAKEALIVVADTKTVGGGDRKWGEFFSWVKSNNGKSLDEI
ncbi:hypothetical protein TrVE_jg3973 [Triparma verrucosa]|uniref:Uncharacterized protein n=1 Tax=Triparma verrucosa TaxID=1606542 RepID=A0A9W7EPC3_9STRA|nr:hypothetical protein TrVE_jg3973 [Triparma verrucosa]